MAFLPFRSEAPLERRNALLRALSSTATPFTHGFFRLKPGKDFLALTVKFPELGPEDEAEVIVPLVNSLHIACMNASIEDRGLCLAAPEPIHAPDHWETKSAPHDLDFGNDPRGAIQCLLDNIPSEMSSPIHEAPAESGLGASICIASIRIGIFLGSWSRCLSISARFPWRLGISEAQRTRCIRAIMAGTRGLAVDSELDFPSHPDFSFGSLTLEMSWPTNLIPLRLDVAQAMFHSVLGTSATLPIFDTEGCVDWRPMSLANREDGV